MPRAKKAETDEELEAEAPKTLEDVIRALLALPSQDRSIILAKLQNARRADADGSHQPDSDRGPL